MKRFKPRTIRWIGRFHAWLWTLTRGRFVDAAKEAPFLLLTTTGRKTGRSRTTPVLYLEDGSELVVVASFGGNDMHPAWYLNLKQYPEAEVLIRGEHLEVTAREITSEEKKIIWRRLVKLYPQFDVYQQRTRREIPLMRLTRKIRLEQKRPGWPVRRRQRICSNVSLLRMPRLYCSFSPLTENLHFTRKQEFFHDCDRQDQSTGETMRKLPTQWRLASLPSCFCEGTWLSRLS
jgi:F420H(2)-dependent quinone reductase